MAPRLPNQWALQLTWLALSGRLGEDEHGLEMLPGPDV